MGKIFVFGQRNENALRSTKGAKHMVMAGGVHQVLEGFNTNVGVEIHNVPSAWNEAIFIKIMWLCEKGHAFIFLLVFSPVQDERHIDGLEQWK